MSAIARPRRSRGQALAEFAFVIPIFLALLLGVFDVGRVVWATNATEQASREAARYAIVHGAITEKQKTLDEVKQDIRDVALESATAAGANVTATVCYGTGCSGDTDAAGASNARGMPVTVVVRSQIPLVAGAFLGLGMFQVNGSSTMLVNH